MARFWRYLLTSKTKSQGKDEGNCKQCREYAESHREREEGWWEKQRRRKSSKNNASPHHRIESYKVLGLKGSLQ